MQRVTKQRVIIMSFLSKQKEFLSAQNIHDALKNGGETIGLATVYRTLQSLAESRQIDSIRSTEGEILYRKCDLEEHHHHLVCKSCGKIVEISGDVFEKWIDDVARQYSFHHIEHVAELFGVCSACNK
ncbi:transcriptional repressor [Actinomyces sp. zg-332]|uniref:Fur family transcriptional regulator n=1 Tax=Actinomyces sp. zg-332 TaxID=2708340 RepID=UPI00141E347A|nr:Fur family transcriptional regulator [Actinomyces sp. zg-332]QPK94525.1 transcriptional repressor [Actinomyces sp. zg-332]